VIPVLFDDNKKIMKLYFGFFISFGVIALFQLLRVIFGPNFLSFGGFFNNPVSNLVGKWNDLGIFFGLSAVLSLSAIELLRVSKPFKIILYIALVLSLLFSALINFTTVWVVLAIVSLFFFVYRLMFGEHRRQGGEELKWSASKFLSPTSISVFIVAIVFVIAGGFLGSIISGQFNISQIEARPSWSSTFDIAGESLKDDILFGVGPNRFYTQWLLDKPDGINNTLFWNTDFNSGIGTIPSAPVTTGLVGSIAWLAFIIMFLLYGLREILSTNNKDLFAKYISLSSFLAALYLWIFVFFYVPGVVILTLTFLFSGIFIASQIRSGRIQTFKITFMQNPKAGFISVFVIVVLLVGTVSLGFAYAKKYVSFVHFQSGIIAFNQDGNIDRSEQKLLRAIRLNNNDSYYRALSQLDIVRLNQVVLQQGVPEDTLRGQFQSVLGTAIANATEATNIDSRNYQNWIALGQVYGSIVSLGVEGSYESAKSAYNRALELNPHNPSIYLTLARLEATKGDIGAAREHIDTAIKEKSNYTAAVFFLSQIEIAEGNINAAILSVETAATIAPNDPTIFFQLGLLRYNNGQFAGSVTALERAVALLPAYANAKYFLGLSYYNVGRIEDSIGQFEDVSALNQDNEEVKQILVRLNSGQAPFENLTPPESTPEDRETLPIEE